jgi:phospholipase C
MPAILPQIKHIIVVMLENRSFDNICGWLYKPGVAPAQPSQFLPAGTPQEFDGLKSTFFNPVDRAYFSGTSTATYPVFDKATATNIPVLDPLEDILNVNVQLFGPESDNPNPNPKYPNMGFVINYADAIKQAGLTNIPVEVMEPFSSDQLPVISNLAWNYAVCDAWFSSVPSDTWPNRAFFHAGTSNGNAVNGAIPNPFDWDVPNIFKVLDDLSLDWRVYSDTEIVPALTWLMFPNLWLHTGHFHHFDDFKQDCASGNLALYTFLEPSFLVKPNDEHPPHDVVAGEQFLYEIWQAVSQSPAWPETLLMITYDEHGGTYDHKFPPFNAVPPDNKQAGPPYNFSFNRFGVRVPAVLVSPWIQAGTVFRSPIATPYDHTSILSTLRDWLPIPADKMLTSARITAAPTLEQVFTLEKARTDLPVIPPPVGEIQATATFKEPTPIQRSLVAAYAVQQDQDPADVLSNVKTSQDAINYFTANKSEAVPPFRG